MNESDDVDVNVSGTGLAEATRPLPMGLRRSDADDVEIVDAMAGRASVFGFGHRPIVETIERTARGYLGDASAFAELASEQDGVGDGEFADALWAWLGETEASHFQSARLCPTAEHAIEAAIGIARRDRSDRAFRTIAMVGSDHGRTGVCRTASGRPDLHHSYGPMMAGFAHVPAGDLNALDAVIDDQTACVLLSPIDLNRAAIACEENYLVGVRQLCDQRSVLLAIDETQIALGASGQPFSFRAIADIRADMVIIASGLFAGLSGGALLTSGRAAEADVVELGPQPMPAAVATQTLRSMVEESVPSDCREAMHQFAVALAETVSGFEFVRDVHALGMTIGIETDLPSADIIRAARKQGLRVERAGENSIRMQPPLVICDADKQSVLERLSATMDSLERDMAEMTI